MREQSANRRRHHDISTFFTYERLCGDPELAAQQVMSIVPEIDDLDLSARVRVKDTYDEPLRDMNRDHLARLAPDDRAVAQRIFTRHTELFAEFGYDVG